MSCIRKKYDEEFKKNAVKFSYASPKTVKEIADDLGVGENLLYNWRKKYTKDGDKSRSTTLEEENKALRLEESTSEHGTRYVKKSDHLLRSKIEEKYQFISERHDYSAAKRAKAKENARKKEIERIFRESRNTYGTERICAVIRKSGGKASYRCVKRFMNELGLSSVHNKHKTRSLTNSKNARTGDYPNLTKGIPFTKPLQAVCSDITYIKDGEGWLYLCAVKDICSGELLGNSTSVTMKSELVIKAFMNASARHSFSKGIINKNFNY